MDSALRADSDGWGEDRLSEEWEAPPWEAPKGAGRREVARKSREEPDRVRTPDAATFARFVPGRRGVVFFAPEARAAGLERDFRSFKVPFSFSLSAGAT
jgi:hypothetical protein